MAGIGTPISGSPYRSVFSFGIWQNSLEVLGFISLQECITFAMVVKDDKIRKLVTISKDLWAEIDDIRFEARFKTESDVMRYLLESGVKAHNAKGRKKR